VDRPFSATRRVGRYEIIGELGRGGMAVVYLARQLDLGRSVALKELSSLHASEPGIAERFLRESRMAGSLSHPNIVTVHEYFEQAGVPFIAMEYVPRGSLRPYIGRLSLAQIAGVMESVLAGLAHAEQAGIVHRDLKPENIVVTAEGRVKIADFGIAKATQTAGMTSGLTATGSAVGTPTYMAPEQAMGQQVGPWTDLYSVGVMAYEHLTGKPPFYGDESPMVMLMRHVNEPVKPAVVVMPSVDKRLSDWIDRLLVKEPAERTRSAVEAWDALEEIVISLLGPRWRRAARLDEPAGTTGTPRPLTPAPFLTKPDPGGAATADSGFVTFDPRPTPAEPAALPLLPPPSLPSVTVAQSGPPLPEPAVAPPPREIEVATAPQVEVAPAPPEAEVATARSEIDDTTTPQATELLALRTATAPAALPPSSRWRRPRGRLAWLGGLLIVAAAATAIIAVAASGGGTDTTKASRSTTTAHAIAPSSPALPSIASKFVAGGLSVRGPIALTTGGTPGGLVVAGRDAWVTDTENNLLVLIRENGSELRIRVGRAPVGVALDPATSDLWVANEASGDVTVVSGSGNVVRRSIMAGPRPRAISIGSGAAWVADSGDATVTRIDTRTFATKQIQVEASPTAIGNEYAREWVARSDSSMTVLAGDGSPNGTVKLPGAGSPLAISSSNGVWVVRGAAGLSRIDPRTQVAIRTTPPYQYLVHPGSPKVGGDPRDVGALGTGPGDNTIWVIARSDHLLSRIGTLAPNNEKVLATIPVGSAPDHLAVAAHVVWVDDPPARALYEVRYSH
jgi:DNA-binding beta-propeller fold protein YncE